ncbi:hypothetical protein V7O66_03360 [Methanolobus sp. ZRKC3]|uniref:hypothetical protein n=1 Tax=Methanolobus sp. ZRKC3 TaxID=3125786 RepID=UPI00324515D6
MRNDLHLKWVTIAFVAVLVISAVAFSMWDQSRSNDETEVVEQVNNTTSSQENTEEELEITEYTFENYGGKIYTPEPMEFGANLINGTIPENTSIYNETERKHVMLQFYSIPFEEQLELLEECGVHRVGVAAEYTYIFSMPEILTAADLPADSGLRWMGELPVKNKYDHSFGLNVPERARTDDGQVELWLAFYEDVTYEEAQVIASKYSTSAPKFEMYPYSFNSIIITNESNLTVIAAEDSIQRFTFGGEVLVPE